MFERLRSSTLRVLSSVHPHQVVDLSEHTRELRALRVLRRAADLAEAERAERAAVAPALADRATRLGDLQLRHRSPVAPRPRRAARAPRLASRGSAGPG